MPLLMFRKTLSNLFDALWPKAVLGIKGSQNGLYDKTFVDNSANNYNVVQTGSVRQGIASPFAKVAYPETGSIYFDSNAYLTVPASVVSAITTQNFTMECWVNLGVGAADTSKSTEFFVTLTNGAWADVNGVWFGKHASAGGKISFWVGNFPGGKMLEDPVLPTENVWYHYAVVRNGNVFTLYRNGVSVAQATWNGALTGASITSAHISSASAALTKYITNFRISKVARYTANFQALTAPLISDVNTNLLLSANSAALHNRTVIDSSSNNLTAAVLGNVTQGSVTPFVGAGGSAYFDGVGDRLTYAASPVFNLSGTDFTFECWFNLAKAPVGADCRALMVGSNGTSSALVALSIKPSLQLVAGLPFGASQAVISQTNAISLNTWYHYALVVKTNGEGKMFLNGALVGSVSNFALPTSSTTNTFQIGYDTVGTVDQQFMGYMSNVKFTKRAVYAAAFEPSKVPLTNDANTALLLKFDSALVVDEACRNNIEMLGNVAVSLAQKRFGATSLYFDGTAGTCLRLPPSNDFAFGSGDFTVEMWIKPSSGAIQRLLQEYSTAVNGSIFGIFINGSSVIGSFSADALDDGNPSKVGSSCQASGLIMNQWNHIAFVRNGNKLRMYVNGVGGTEVTTTITMTSTTFPMYVGARWYTGTNSIVEQCLNLYMDDLLVLKGWARYTGPSFALPDKAFQND